MKRCQSCGTERHFNEFTYSSDTADRLSNRCRWCNAYRHGTPSPELIEAYLHKYSIVLNRAGDLLQQKVRRVGAGKNIDLIQDNRTLYENLVVEIHDRLGLTKDWEYPCWIAKSTLFVGEGNDAS